MNKLEVSAVVRRLAWQMKQEGASAWWAGYIVNPRDLVQRLEGERPDVYRHIRRHYPGDPYQTLKVWIPRR